MATTKVPDHVLIVHAFNEQEPRRWLVGHVDYLTSMPWSATVASSASVYSTART